MHRFARQGRPGVEVVEWETATLPADFVLTDHDRALVRSLADGDARLVVDELPSGSRLRTTSWIGLISFEAFDVHVVPKYVGGDLGVLEMLDFTRGLDGLSRAPAVRHLATEGAYLVDLIGLLAAETSERLTRDGLLQDYVPREETLGVIRGRLLPYEQLTRHPRRVDVLECRYDEFEADIDENRLVAAGLEAARGLCRHETVRRRVNRSRAIFADACDHRALDARWVDGPYDYDRRNEHYRVPHEYARLLLGGLAVRDLFALGATKSFVFMVDMNRVFEDFVTRLLQTAVADLGLAIDIQHRISGRIIESQTGHTYRSVIPDLVLRGPTVQGIRVVPVDAKYKLYGERPIDNADLYQLFFYAFVHRPAAAPVGSSGLPIAFIVYPVSGGSRVDLVFTDLHGAPGARLTGIGLDVPAALAAIRDGTTHELPLVAALTTVFKAGLGVIAA